MILTVSLALLLAITLLVIGTNELFSPTYRYEDEFDSISSLEDTNTEIEDLSRGPSISIRNSITRETATRPSRAVTELFIERV